ncbi:MAG: hypothetical protein IAG10_28590 [Planctomycetaceae bacterium]|nr:hypothetical protein [Planctomycetaceae bacterium]
MLDFQDPPPVPRVAVRLASQLEQLGIDYAIGGAIAMAFWCEPRATFDVDLTLFLDATQHEFYLQILRSIGCEVETEACLITLRTHGFCRVFWQGRQVDVFLPTTDFYVLAKHRRHLMPILGQDVVVWSAEVLAVFKLMFFREKDRLDLKRLWQAQGPRLGLDSQTDHRPLRNT